MRRMRKLLLSIGLVCTTLIAVAACGGNGAATTHSAATTAPPAAAASPQAAAAASPQAAAVALYRCESRLQAWDGSSAIDLTGTWAGDDSGVYYLRQLGDQVWWLGMSGLGGPLVDRGTDWTNVYRGTLAGWHGDGNLRRRARGRDPGQGAGRDEANKDIGWRDQARPCGSRPRLPGSAAVCSRHARSADDGSNRTSNEA